MAFKLQSEMFILAITLKEITFEVCWTRLLALSAAYSILESPLLLLSIGTQMEGQRIWLYIMVNSITISHNSTSKKQMDNTEDSLPLQLGVISKLKLSIKSYKYHIMTC